MICYEIVSIILIFSCVLLISVFSFYDRFKSQFSGILLLPKANKFFNGAYNVYIWLAESTAYRLKDVSNGLNGYPYISLNVIGSSMIFGFSTIRLHLLTSG